LKKITVLNKWIHRLLNFKFKLVGYTLLLILFFANLFYFSQDRIAEYALQYLSANTGFQLSVKHFKLDIFGEIILNDVLIRDREQRPMIKVHELRINFSPMDIYRQGEICAKDAYICGAAVNLWYHKDSKELNIIEWIDSFDRLSSDTTKDSTYHRFVLKIPDIQIEDSYFSFNEVNEDSLPAHLFDYYHFQFSKINAKVKDFRVADDTIELYAKNLQTIEPINHWKVHSLNTFFSYSDKAMTFKKLDVKVGQSHVFDELGLFYNDLNEFSDFNKKVKIKANIKNSTLHSKDLALFADFFKQYNKSVLVNGKIDGTVEDLHTDNVRIKLANSELTFDKMHFKGLPDVDLVKMDVSLKHSKLNAEDILYFVPPDYHHLVNKLGKIDFQGKFDGVYDNFLADGIFKTSLGEVQTNLKMDLKNTTYEGALALRQFDLGKYIDDKNLGLISMQGIIKGKGFLRKDVDFFVDAKVDSVFALDYFYQNLLVNGNMKEGIFNGKASINDAFLKVMGEGLIDITNEQLKFKADINKANLKDLKLTQEVINISTLLDVDIVGLNIDNAVGRLNCFRNRLLIKDKEFIFDSLKIKSEYFDNLRHLDLKSDWADIYTSGHFNITRLYEEVLSTTSHYLQYINDTVPPPRLQVPDTSFHDINLDILCKNINPILHAYVDSAAFLSQDAYFSGQLLLDSDWNLFLNGGADSFSVAHDVYFTESVFQINASKERLAAPINASIDIHSERQHLLVPTKNMNLQTTLKDKRIAYDFNIDSQTNTDTVSITGDFDFSEATWLFRLFPDTIRVLEYSWEAENEVIVSLLRDKITFEKAVDFKSGAQEFHASGTFAKNPTEVFQARLKSFDINILSPLIGYKIEGAADINLTLRDVYDTAIINGDVLVRNVAFESNSVGDLSLKIDWLETEKKFALNGAVAQRNIEVFAIDGFLDMKQEKEQLDAVIQIINGKFNLISPFVKDILSDIDGKIFGAVKVSGRLDNPQFAGEAYITRGAFRIDYLNTSLRFDDKIIIQNNGIVFDRVKMTDKYGRPAYIEGGLYHENYQNFSLDMRGELYNVLVLNTNPKLNSLYHGTAFATGDWRLTGDFDKVDIVVNLRSEKDTKFFLPIGGAETVESSFIRFKRSDSLDVVMAKEFKDRIIAQSNIRMVLNLDLSKDTYMEIIFDQKAGDIIKGYAEGKIKMIIDTEGDFSMFGSTEIVKGGYNFTFMNIINKAFEVSQGSTITWDGDPYAAKLNITAKYRQMASLAPIILGADSTILKRPEIRRKYPVIVDLYLRGDLLSPDITFDIECKDYPTTVVAGGAPILLDANVQAFKQRIDNDEQELNRQVFSLIVLKRLSEQNNMMAGINQSAVNNLSELLTNQLSAWLSQVDENLQVDIDLNGITPEALQTLQLRLSYSFFDNKMRLTREGTFTNVQNQTSFSSVMGDWILEYNITESGRLRLKAYYRNNYTNYDASLQSNANSGGSLLFNLSFDNLKNLFKRTKKVKKTIIDDEIKLENLPK